MKLFGVLLLLSMGFHVCAQQPDTVFLKTMLEKYPDLFGGVLHHPTQNEVQIMYTQIDRDAHNKPRFTVYTYRLNTKRYFYPASTVKLPTLIFALEKLNGLNIPGLHRATPMETDSALARQVKITTDTTAANGMPSIEQYIKRILLVSDNDAYNRLYEFTGRETINAKLKHYGLNDSRIVSRLAVGDKGENARHTNPIRFFKGDQTIYLKPAAYDTLSYPMPMQNTLQGKGYLDNKGQLVNAPFDFSEMNIYPIADQQMVLRRLMFPEAFDEGQRFKLTGSDYKLIYKYMSMYPTESRHPTYPAAEYPPAYCKFLFYGADSAAVINPDIRIFNKVGDSYGYDIDNANIVDFKNKVEFMLTAVVQSNEDGIYNDNKYEYATICLPFLKNLGQLIYQYELTRKKEHLPDLKKFKLNY